MTDCKACKQKRSEEWSLSKELAKSNRRMFVALITVIALWFATIGGFVWYLNQYDFSGYSVEATQDGEGVNIVGGEDVNYGTDSQNQSTKEN